MGGGIGTALCEGQDVQASRSLQDFSEKPDSTPRLSGSHRRALSRSMTSPDFCLGENSGVKPGWQGAEHLGGSISFCSFFHDCCFVYLMS